MPTPICAAEGVDSDNTETEMTKADRTNQRTVRFIAVTPFLTTPFLI